MLYSFMAFAGNIRRMFNMTAKMAAIFTYTYTSTVNLLSPRLFHFHLIHTFPLFSVCVCVYPPPPPSSFSLADCRCVNTCWKEVWQWARRWMQSRLVNNALWHSSVGECSVFCSALTPPPQKKMFCSYPTHWTLIMFSPWPLCSQPDTSPSSSSCTDLLLLLPVCSHFDSCVQCSRRERLKPVSADSSLSC